MPFEKGKIANPKGKKKGTKGKKPRQWAAFANYCLEGGLEKFQREMDKLQGKDFVHAFIDIMEFHKPKLSRTELSGATDNTIRIVDETK